jgi:diguanylate cyclase
MPSDRELALPGDALPAPPLTADGVEPVGAARARDLRFARRTHRMRAIGLALGALAVASVLQLHAAAPSWWLLLAVNGFVWPHVAWWYARRSAEPRRAEVHNLMVDSFAGGVWMAAMHFNLLPSVVLFTMLAIDKLTIGGLGLVARSIALQAAGAALGVTLTGFAVDLHTPMPVVVACLPFLVVYPTAISTVAYELARKVTQQNRRLEEVGRTDGLTGLGNRRHAFRMAEHELERHYRTGRPAVLMLLDVDRFKTVNDRFGHPAGDAVLCGVAEVLRASCRTIDTLARYGGDEFLLVLPETDIRGATEVAQRIRERAAALEIAGAPGLRCTVSLGAAEADRQITNVDVWVQQADVALYRAKSGGRDRFVSADRGAAT